MMPVNIDIPYRCPNCGDQVKFSTLNELRCHLENEHSYQTKRSRRRVNLSDFDRPNMHSNSMSDLSRISPLTERFHEDTLMLEEEVRRNKEVELNNKRHRAGSVESLLDRDHPEFQKSARKMRNTSKKASFRDYGLPSRLTRHLNHSPRSRKHTNREYPSQQQVAFSHQGDDDFLDDSNPQLHLDEHILNGLSHRISEVSGLKPSPKNSKSRHVGLSHTVHALSKEIMIERASQQATAESLYSANNTLIGVERAAEERIALQQRVIENLAEELKDKEKRLTSLIEEMDHLRQQQESLKKANVLNSNLDFESKHLQQELVEKQRELEVLAKNVEQAKQFMSADNLKDQIPEKLSHLENTLTKSLDQDDNRNKLSHTMKDKTFTVYHASASKEPTKPVGQEIPPEIGNEDELRSVKHKAQQLEKDRHSLLVEMQTLLESAAVDNEKLRQELHNQEQKMSRMNLDLKSSKHEQAELMGETHELYHQADVGLTKLKMMLKERDRQLSGVSSALEQARDIQEKLVKERDESLKQAAEREGMYRAMLTANSEQLKTMKDALASNQESKHTVEMNLRKLNHQLQSKGIEDMQMKQKVEHFVAQLRRREEKESKLKAEIQRREEKLKKAKREMERMTEFLRTTSDKETAARMKLEGFISKLLERAERAESELKKLHKDKDRKSKYPKKRSTHPEKHQEKAHEKSHSKRHDKYYSSSHGKSGLRSSESPDQGPHDRSYDSPDNRPHKRSYDSPDHIPHDGSFESPGRSLHTPYNRPVERQELMRDEAARMNFSLQAPSELGPNTQFPTAPGLVASYPPDSDFATRPTFANIPVSFQPQNPFYLHRPRRQTYNNAASMYTSPSVPAYEYDVDPQSNLHRQLFQNTPEIDGMIRNVQRQSFLSSYNPASLKDVDSGRAARERSQKSTPMLAKGKLDFSVDDDGIMWERHATPSPHHSLKAVHDSARKPQVLDPDDTDIGEVSDFVYEDEHKFYKEPENCDALSNPLHPEMEAWKGKAPMREKTETPYGDETERLFLVSQPYTLNPEGQDEQENIDNHSHDAVAETSEASPLSRAKEVQKRVEEWTALKKSESPLYSSRGFDAEQAADDSDFSTSSYTSFKRTREPVKRDAGQAKKNEVTHVVDVEPIKLSQCQATFNANQAVSETSPEKKNIAHDSNLATTSPVVEELVTPSSKDAKVTHKFAGRVLIKPSPLQRAISKDTSQADNDFSERSEFSRRTNSLPVKKAEEEANLLSQAEIDLQEETKVNKVVPKRQISIIQSSSMEETDAVCMEDEESPEMEANEVFIPEIETAAEQSAGLYIRDEKNTYDDQVPENVKQTESYNDLLHGRDESPALISHVSDAVNAETVTEYDSPDEYPLDDELDYGNQVVTQNEGEAPYQSSEGISSSEDEITGVGGGGGKGDHRKSESKEKAVMSVDASTDTDLEKLAQPGHAHRGFPVRKNTPVVRHVVRRKPRKIARNDPGQQSLSSADELDSSAKSKKKSIKNMRVVLFHVFSYLDTTELLTASLVNKEWCKISRHPALWKSVSLHNRSISSEFLVELSKWCTKTEYLSLKGLRGRGIQAEEDPEEYQAALRGSLEAGLEKFLSACQDTICTLEIHDCDNILTDKCIWIVSGYCRLLTKLSYNSSIDPLHSQLVFALGGGCPGITSLFVQPQHPCTKTGAMNNKCLLMISQFYRDLQEVGIGGKEFDVGGIMPLVQACQHLHHVSLEHCIPVTADLATGLCRAGLKQLQTITMTGTSVEVKAVQALQNNCRQLKKININVTLQDCVDNPSNKKDKEKYKKMVKALQGLKSKAAFAKILFVDAGPAE